MPEPRWQDDGACSTLSLEESDRIFFDERRAHIAQKFCGTCEVLQTCRKWALETPEEYGTWGGLTAADRADILAALAA